MQLSLVHHLHVPWHRWHHPVKWFSVLIAALIAMILPGCLHLQQEITLDKDGEGRFALRLSLDKSLYEAAIAPAGSPLGKRWDRFFHTDTGMAVFAAQQGVKVDSYRVFEQDDRIYVQVAGAITDFDQLAKSGLLGAWRLAHADNGDTTLTWEPGDDGRRNDNWGPALEGMRLRMVIRVPGTISETNATTRDGNTLVWDFDAAKGAGQLVQPTPIHVTFR